MNATGICILALTSVVVLFAPRRWAVLGIMVGLLSITQAQAFDVFGLNITAHRILVVLGYVRVMARREFSFDSLNRIDRTLLVLYIYITIVYLITCMVRSAEFEMYNVANSADAFLCYFTFRGLIGDFEDFRWFLRIFVFFIATYVPFLLIEMFMGSNVFAHMGGVIEGALSRGGRPRCWGSFRHPIALGVFGASFIPLYIGLAFVKADRARACVGACLCLVIVGTSNSGGPLTAVGTAIVGWLLWIVKTRMYILRSAMVGTFILASIVMKAPVWYLLARLSSITGGTGYHRAYLIDISVKNLEKWWLIGMPLSETHDWFPYTSDLLVGADITNHYLHFGLYYGLGALALFILLLVRAYSSIGRALSAVRAVSGKPRGKEYMLWGLGVMLSIHLVSMIGLGYFDQLKMIWFMQLAAISSLAQVHAKSN